MASDKGTGTPDERLRDLASLNLLDLAGELSILAHAAAIGENYDADKMNVLTDALCTIGWGERVMRRAIRKRVTQRTAELNTSRTRRPLAGSAVRRIPRSTQFGTWPGNEAAAAP
eukprot:4647749-Pleurochrysis_carterae.AAC.1